MTRSLQRSARAAVISLCALAASATPLHAQSAATASLGGTVLDPSNARVSGAMVTVSDTDTGVSRSTQTGTDGVFVVSLLPPGRYTVRIEKSGLATLQSDGVTLEVAEQRQIELRMQLGDVRDAVTVEAQASRAAGTDISLVVNERRVEDLPLNGKNFLKLALLTPGVGVANSNPLYSGARNVTNTYLIDGVGSSDQRGSRGLAVSGGAALFTDASPNLISTEAIREFRVISSNADATFGRASGGQISLITKSGTNDLHGSAYYYIRNDALDARDFFNTGPFLDSDGHAKVPPFKQHQYGFTVGGPVKKNRSFYFGNFEGFRQKLRQTNASTVVPNAALISLIPGDLGRFYQTYYIERGAVPSSGNPPGDFRPIYATEDERQKFLAAGFNPALFDGDLANGEAGAVRLSSANTRDVDQDSVLVRTDHYLTDRLSVSAKYAGARSQQLTNLVAFPFNNSFIPLRWHHPTAQANYVISPSQNLELRAGVVRSTYAEGSASAVDSALLGIGVSDLGVSINPGGTSFSQFTVNPERNFFDYQTVPEVSLIHSWVRGRVTLRSGLQWRKSYLNTFSAGSATPVYTFSGYIGPNGLLGQGPGQAQAIASSLSVTKFGTGGGTNTPLRGYRQTEQEYFTQADVRLGSQVTANLGLRYSYFGVLSEQYDLLSNLYAVNEGGQIVADASPFAFGRFANTVGRVGDDLPFYQPDKNNFQPRVGVAWDIGARGATIVRASYGTYIDRLIQLMVLSAPNSTPFSLAGSAAQVPFTLGGIPDLSASSAPGIFGIDPTIRNPVTHRYNVTLEQRLDRATTVAVSYVGAKGRDLTWNQNYNGGSFGVPQAARPDQRFALMTITTNGAKSDYDSLQLLAQRRLSHGLDLTVSYTYAKSRDNVTQDAFGSPPALINIGGSPASGFQGGGPDGWIPRPLSANWGYSDFDLRHNLAISYVWELPFGQGRRFLSSGSGLLAGLVGGWSLAGVTIMRSGAPVDLQYSGDLADVGAFNVRPVLVSGSLADLYANGSGARTQYLIPAEQARQLLPNINVTDPSSWVERNALRGPSIATFDMSLMKRIPLAGRTSLALQVNAFNVFNHANFGNPTANLGSAFFGQVTTIAPGTTPRQLQFGAKLEF